MRPRSFLCLTPLLASAVLLGCSATAPTTIATATATPVTTPVSGNIPNLQQYANSAGSVATYTIQGLLDVTSPFFQTLGSNGRTCATCHQPSQAMSVNSASALALFRSTQGTDPLFAAVDGANYPTAATGDAASHSLLLNNALFRIVITLPASRQFSITATHDPYGTAIVTDPATGRPTVSVYRRSLPAANLTYLSDVMWDGRHTHSSLASTVGFSANLDLNLTQQLLDAITTHAQGTTAPSAAQQNAILLLEEALFTAQLTDANAGILTANGAGGGPSALVTNGYYPGINDAFGGDPQTGRFTQNAFTLYSAWNNSGNAAQASIARGQALFNTSGFNITGVRGINDNPALGSPATVRGTCTTCHDAPNLGHHSLPLSMDIGVAHLAASETNNAIRSGLAQITAPDLPVYQITGCTDLTGVPVTYTTTDPGRALVTGLCADVNRVKVPILRGLAARAPFFHNGSAAGVADIVDFYDSRFNMNLSNRDKQDLVNFLNAL